MHMQDQFFGPTDAASYAPIVARATTSAVERLVFNVLRRSGVASDDLLTLADAIDEIILEAPSDSDTRRLREMRDHLRLIAPSRAGIVPGQAEAEALLRACPADLASLRMWRAAMGGSCSAWGWTPILDALIAAAEAMAVPKAGCG